MVTVLNQLEKTYSIVSNGQSFIFWDRRVGNWNTVNVFEPICLLDEDAAEGVAKDFNEDRSEDESPWLVCRAELTIYI